MTRAARVLPVAPAAGAASDVDSLAAGVRAGNRRALAKAITLIESRRADHRAEGEALLARLLPATGGALRMGISGAPGAGKSTFIEALGLTLVREGRRVAVLAVDPSSSRSGGSILGDKTRMEELSRHPNAFIRPSPSGGTLGGVAARTREAMLACEAAGFDVVIVETVGVGQSETAVAGMTDVFVLVQMPNAGDELQAIKRGIVELADVIVYNKVDIDPRAAQLAMGQMKQALSMLRPAAGGWRPPVVGVSAVRRDGIEAFWREVVRCRDTLAAGGELQAKRRRQSLDWMWALIDAGLREHFRSHPGVRAALPECEAQVEAGTLAPTAAARRLLDILERRSHHG
ncbi:MAG TPA: methylmalonyl Co-A mutase-associated GTPase MeaB [Casimicrobiaceae bacterium]|nr:methylmalonyl Co-A mutase-associated GTPase MeaB [Casimicrobiaceae bacterium]